MPLSIVLVIPYMGMRFRGPNSLHQKKNCEQPELFSRWVIHLSSLLQDSGVNVRSKLFAA